MQKTKLIQVNIGCVMGNFSSNIGPIMVVCVHENHKFSCLTKPTFVHSVQ